MCQEQSTKKSPALALRASDGKCCCFADAASNIVVVVTSQSTAPKVQFSLSYSQGGGAVFYKYIIQLLLRDGIRM